MREFPGIREALAGLVAGGYRLGVVTSKRSFSALPDLEFFRLDEFFEVVITADDTTQHKPEPEPVLEALRRLEAAPAQATFIGDSPYDLRCAHAAGVLAGAVAWGPFAREVLQAEEPDYWIPDPPALLTLFPGVNKVGSELKVDPMRGQSSMLNYRYTSPGSSILWQTITFGGFLFNI